MVCPRLAAGTYALFGNYRTQLGGTYSFYVDLCAHTGFFFCSPLRQRRLVLPVHMQVQHAVDVSICSMLGLVYGSWQFQYVIFLNILSDLPSDPH